VIGSTRSSSSSVAPGVDQVTSSVNATNKVKKEKKEKEKTQ